MREDWENESRYQGKRYQGNRYRVNRYEESLYTGGGRQGKRGKKRKRRRRHRILKSILCIALIIPMVMAVLWAKDMISGQSSLAVMALINP